MAKKLTTSKPKQNSSKKTTGSLNVLQQSAKKQNTAPSVFTQNASKKQSGPVSVQKINKDLKRASGQAKIEAKNKIKQQNKTQQLNSGAPTAGVTSSIANNSPQAKANLMPQQQIKKPSYGGSAYFNNLMKGKSYNELHPVQNAKQQGNAGGSPYFKNKLRPNIADRYSDNDVYRPNTAFKVNTMTPDTQLDLSKQINAFNRMKGHVPSSVEKEAESKLPMQNMERWYIKDGSDLPGITNTVPGAAYKTVGRDKLDGIRQDDKVLLYDRNTGLLYRYDQEDEQSIKLKNEMYSAQNSLSLTSEAYSYMASKAKTNYEHAKSRFDALTSKAQESGSLDAHNEVIKRAYDELTKAEENYNSVIDEANTQLTGVYGNYEEKRKAYNDYGVFGVSPDYDKKVNEDYENFKYNMDKTEMFSNVLASSEDPYTPNSLKDVLVGLGKAFTQQATVTKADLHLDEADKGHVSLNKEYIQTYQGCKTPAEVIKRYLDVKVAPYKLFAQGELGFRDAAKANLNNILVDMSETVDMLGAGEVKSLFINATPYFRAYVESVKAGDTIQDHLQKEKDKWAKESPTYDQSAAERIGDYFGVYGKSANYDWDTGSVLMNIALETVSDPANVIGAIGKKAMSELSQDAIRTELKGMTGLSDDLLDPIARDIAKNVAKGDDLSVQLSRVTSKLGAVPKELDIQSAVNNINDTLLKSNAYKISESFVDIADATQKFQGNIMSAEFLGANKILKPVAEFGLNAVGKPIIKTTSVAYDYLKNSIGKYFTGDMTGIKPDLAPEVICKGIENDVRHITDLSGLDLNLVTREAKKEVYNMVARNELAQLVKVTDEKSLKEFMVSVGLYSPDILSKESSTAFQQTYKEQLITYYESINKTLTNDMLTKDNTALLNAVNKKIYTLTTDTLADVIGKIKIADTLKMSIDTITAKSIETCKAIISVGVKDNTAEDIMKQSHDAVQALKDAIGTMEYSPLEIAFKSSLDDSCNALISSLSETYNYAIKGRDIPQELLDRIDLNKNNVKKQLNSYTGFLNAQNASKVMYAYPDAAIPKFDIKVGEKLATPDSNDKTFEDVLKDIFTSHGATANEEKINSLMHKAYSTDTDTQKAIAISETYKTAQYINNEDLIEAAEILGATDNEMTAFAATVTGPLRQVENFANQRQLILNITQSPNIPYTTKCGVIDFLTAANKNKVDRVIRNADLLDSTGYNNCVDKITSLMEQHADRTMIQRSNDNMYLWRNKINNEIVNFNTACTDDNIRNMLKYMDSDYFEPVRAMFNVADDEVAHNNVFFSVAFNRNSTEPCMITIADRSGDIRTFVNASEDLVVDANYARTKFNCDADIAMKSFSDYKASHPEQCFDKHELLKKIDETLKEFDTKYRRDDDGIFHPMRLVGWNNGYAVSNQNADVTRMLMTNKFVGKYYERADMGDAIRKNLGFEFIDDTTHAELRQNVDDVMHNVLLRNFQEVDDASIIAEFKNNDLDMLSKQRKDLLATGIEEDSDMIRVIDSATDGITASREAIVKKSEKFGKYFIDDAELVTALKECGGHIEGDNINLMKDIYKALDKTGNLDYNIIHLMERSLMNEWFDPSAEAFIDVKNMSRITESLNDIKYSIRNKRLVGAFSDEYYNELLNELSNMAGVGTADKLLIGNAIDNADIAHKYCALRYMYQHINDRAWNTNMKNLLSDVVNGKVKDMNPQTELKLVVYSREAEETISNFEDVYTPIRNRLKESDSKINSAVNAFEDCYAQARKLKTFELQIAAQNTNLDAAGFKTAQTLVRTSNIEKFKRLLDGVTDTMESAVYQYKDTAKTDALKMPYKNPVHISIVEDEILSKKMQGMDSTIKAYNKGFNSSQVKQIFSIAPEKLEGFLMNDCYNCIIIDTKSEAVARNIKGLNEFAKSVKEAGLVFDTTYDATKQYIYVYKDVTGMTKQEIVQYINKDYTLGMDQINPDLEPYHSKTKGAYRDVTDNINNFRAGITDYLDESYKFSNGTVFTYEAYDNLQEVIPEAARIDKDVYSRTDKFNCNFQCNVLSDINSEIGSKINGFGSGDILGNMYSAMNIAKDKSEYVLDKFHVLTCPIHSIEAQTAYVRYGADGKAMLAHQDWKEVKKAFDDYGMQVVRPVVRDVKGTKVPGVVPFVIRNQNDYLEALKLKLPVLRNDVIALLNNETKGMLGNLATKNMFTKFFNNLQSDYFNGWLFGQPGTWMRNIGDSNLKAALQTRDMRYVAVRANISNTLSEYKIAEMKLYELLNTQYFGEEVLTEKVLDDLFNGANYKYLNRETFKTILASGQSSVGGVSDVLEDIVADEFVRISDKMANKGFDITRDDEAAIVKIRKKYGDGALSVTDKLSIKDEYKAYFSTRCNKEILDDISEIALHYVPTKSTLIQDMVKKTTVVNKYMEFNKQMFNKAETDTRTSLVLYYTQVRNLSLSEALDKVVESQFDYSKMPKFVNMVTPFMSYKLYNIQFWLETASKDFGIYKPMLNLYKAGDSKDEDDVMEWSRVAYWKNALAQIESDPEQYNDFQNKSYLENYTDAITREIEDYDGSSKYGDAAFGNIFLDDNHLLKVGNSLYDAYDLFFSAMMMPASLNTAIDFAKDNMFSVFGTAYDFVKFMWDNKALRINGDYATYADKMKLFMDENPTAVMDLIPIYGTLANNLEKKFKNANAVGYLGIMFPELGELAMGAPGKTALDILSVASPSVFAVTKDSYFDKPIGYDWYNQSDEYRKTHKFVTGVSYTPAYLKKDPFTYVDTLGKLMKLGYTKEDALEMMQNGWKITMTGKLSKTTYNETGLPDTMKYHPDDVSAMLDYLISKGFTPDEAYALMKENITWVDNTGARINGLKDLDLLVNSKNMLYYTELPNYIKYDWNNQYKPLYDYFKAQGMKQDQIKMAIAFGGYAVDDDNKIIKLTDAQKIAREQLMDDTYMETYANLPDYCKYEDGAYSRTIKFIENNMHMDYYMAADYMIKNNSYLDQDGVFHNYNDKEVEALNAKQEADFKNYYSKLPSHTKYEKGAYSRTFKYLRSAGISKEKAQEMIMNGFYVDVDGNVKNVTGVPYNKRGKKHPYTKYGSKYNDKYGYLLKGYLRRKNKKGYRGKTKRGHMVYGKYHNIKTRKPPKARNMRMYSAGNYKTYSKQNLALANAKNRVQKASYTIKYSRINSKSAYPQAYRNIQYAYRRNMYRDLYAQYGASRMVMRSGGYKMYSNASTTKMRRENYSISVTRANKSRSYVSNSTIKE